MPITFQVDPQQSDIFRWKIIGQWTLEEYFKYNSNATQLMNARMPEPTYVIADITQISTRMPPKAFGLLSSTLSRGPKNWVMTVLVSESELIRRMVKIASLAQPGIKQRFRVASTLEEAEKMVEEHRTQSQPPEPDTP